jgi:Flp pilus assembly protein TadB
MNTILKIAAGLIVAGLLQTYAPPLVQVVVVIAALSWFFLDAAHRAQRAGRN